MAKIAKDLAISYIVYTFDTAEHVYLSIMEMPVAIYQDFQRPISIFTSSTYYCDPKSLQKRSSKIRKKKVGSLPLLNLTEVEVTNLLELSASIVTRITPELESNLSTEEAENLYNSFLPINEGLSSMRSIFDNLNDDDYAKPINQAAVKFHNSLVRFMNQLKIIADNVSDDEIEGFFLTNLEKELKSGNFERVNSIEELLH